MKLQKMGLLVILTGIIMGFALFITGAIAARVIYGPQMTPPGKFKPEQINAWYFFWTKILIGIFFAALLPLLYEKLPLSRRIGSVGTGGKYALLLWLVIFLWGVSHPLVYDGLSSFDKNQLFWMVYSAGGFLGLGLSFGWLRKRFANSSA